jgi:hypothetical protein
MPELLAIELTRTAFSVSSNAAGAGRQHVSQFIHRPNQFTARVALQRTSGGLRDRALF